MSTLATIAVLLAMLGMSQLIIWVLEYQEDENQDAKPSLGHRFIGAVRRVFARREQRHDAL